MCTCASPACVPVAPDPLVHYLHVAHHGCEGRPHPQRRGRGIEEDVPVPVAYPLKLREDTIEPLESFSYLRRLVE